MINKKRVFYSLILIIIAFAIPFVTSVSIGGGSNPKINVENFPPKVWMCDHRIVTDDNTEPGRISPGGTELVERINNYAFEGEQIQWDVLVMDKNKIDQNIDVFVAVGDQKGGSRKPVIKKVNKTVSFCDNIPLTNTNWNNNLVLNKFDSSLGNLVNAKIELNTEMINSINLQNQDIGPINITLNSNGEVNINPIDGPTVSSVIFVSKDFIANQGTNTFNVSDADSKNYSATNLGMYIAGIGNTTFNLPANASATAQLSGSGNFIGGVSTRASAQACVTYTYQVEEAVSPGGTGIEANCQRIGCNQSLMPACNARIDEENITSCNSSIMDMFRCTLTVETPESMYGEHWINVVAIDGDGNTGMMDENEYWFLNPVIALSIDGDMDFKTIRPGTDVYSIQC